MRHFPIIVYFLTCQNMEKTDSLNNLCLIIDSNMTGFGDVRQIILLFKIFIYFKLKGAVYCFHFICNLDELYRRFEVFHIATFYRFKRTLSLNLVRLSVILLPNMRNLCMSNTKFGANYLREFINNFLLKSSLRPL